MNAANTAPSVVYVQLQGRKLHRLPRKIDGGKGGETKRVFKKKKRKKRKKRRVEMRHKGMGFVIRTMKKKKKLNFKSRSLI